jgi:hypothetical protein
MTPTGFDPIDPVLENAVSQIHDEPIDPAVIEAAAARVWARISEAVRPAADHIRGCADFQALIPEFRARRLPEAKATLLQDHLHQCVECRRIYEGRVVSMPVAQAVRRPYTRWAAAAVVVAAAGISVWFAVDQYGGHTGRAMVQSVDGTLYAVTAEGLRPLTAGQDLPDGIEFRTAGDSNALLELRDGSVVELRERSGFSTLQASNDLTVRLNRGSIIVQAAKRRNGSHLFVSTADVRVAVTGTVFSVSAGVKGSRVSVIEGQVRVEENQQQKVLNPGQQSVTSDLQPVTIREDISWSRNRERLFQQLSALQANLQQVHLPALRYSSRLLSRLPAGTVIYGSIPNLAAYLAEAQSVYRQQLVNSPELQTAIAGHGAKLEPLIGKLRAASEYLGDEIAIVSVAGPDGRPQPPVMLAETRRDGFAEFLQKEIGPVPVTIRSGLVVFGPERAPVEALAAVLDSDKGSFQGTPFYARIDEAFRNGAGFLMCADLSRLGGSPLAGARYFIGEHKEVNGRTELRANVGFDGPRAGMAAWLANAAPMASLDYVSPDATIVGAFVVRDPAVIVDQVLSIQQRSLAAAEKALAGAHQQTGLDVRSDLGAMLGGEFTVSLDGPVFPVPSWKLIAEVYDPARMQSALQRFIDAYNQSAPRDNRKPLRTAREVVEGRTYYMIAGGDPNPLTEAHYTYTGGYMIAGPSRALLSRALQVKANGTSITKAAQFVALQPKDHYANFSALVYQNLGTTLAPFAGLLGAFVPQGRGLPPNAMQALGDLKSSLIAVYGENDGITVAGSGAMFGAGLTNILNGNLSGMLGNALPMSRFQGTPAR